MGWEGHLKPLLEPAHQKLFEKLGHRYPLEHQQRHLLPVPAHQKSEILEH
jgi:hypothetical protein